MRSRGLRVQEQGRRTCGQTNPKRLTDLALHRPIAACKIPRQMNDFLPPYRTILRLVSRVQGAAIQKDAYPAVRITVDRLIERLLPFKPALDSARQSRSSPEG